MITSQSLVLVYRKSAVQTLSVRIGPVAALRATADHVVQSVIFLAVDVRMPPVYEVDFGGGGSLEFWPSRNKSRKQRVTLAIGEIVRSLSYPCLDAFDAKIVGSTWIRVGSAVPGIVKNNCPDRIGVSRSESPNVGRHSDTAADTVQVRQSVNVTVRGFYKCRTDKIQTSSFTGTTTISGFRGSITRTDDRECDGRDQTNFFDVTHIGSPSDSGALDKRNPSARLSVLANNPICQSSGSLTAK